MRHFSLEADFIGYFSRAGGGGEGRGGWWCRFHRGHFPRGVDFHRGQISGAQTSREELFTGGGGGGTFPGARFPDTMWSCQTRSNCLTSLLLDRFSPLRGRIIVENISLSIFTKECCRPGGCLTLNLLITIRYRIRLSHRGRQIHSGTQCPIKFFISIKNI